MGDSSVSQNDQSTTAAPQHCKLLPPKFVRVWSLGHDKTLTRPVITILLWTQRILSTPLSSISLSRYSFLFFMGMPHLSVGVPSQCTQVSISYAWVGEPMARVSKMARGIHWSHLFFYFFCPTSISILWRIYARRLYMNYRYYQIILRVKHIYTSWERCEMLTGYLSLGCRPGGDWANMWH